MGANGITLGRIVRYGAGGGKVSPAIVTHVWSDNCVNLYVFPDGSYSDAYSGTHTSVVMFTGEDEGVVGGRDGKWWWPNDRKKVEVQKEG